MITPPTSSRLQTPESFNPVPAMKLPSFILALALLLISATAPARTIDWGSAVGDSILKSNGLALDDSFVFELGTFGSFVPSEANLDQWQANWKIFDRLLAPALNGWDSALGFFDGSATLQTNGTSSHAPPLPANTFAQGEQAYIWVYNGFTIDALTEWALVTNNSLDGNPLDDWLMPAHADQTALPLDWRLSNATQVPFGGLNDVEGPGDYSVTPPSFELQTHVVPEPASALLVGLATFVLRCRRRRR